MSRVFLILLFSIASAADAGLRLTANVKRSAMPENKEPTVTEQVSTVSLAPTYIEVRSGDSTSIRDYLSMRTWQARNEVDGYVSGSVYSDVGFRIVEFNNRLKLGRLLGQAGVDDVGFDVVAVEHLFSISTGKEAAIERIETGSSVTYRTAEADLLSHSLDGTPISKADGDRFVLYLRNSFGIHPQILERIKDGGAVPNSLVVHLKNVVDERIEVGFSSVDAQDFGPLQEITPLRTAPKNRLRRLAHQVASRPDNAVAESLARLEEMAGNCLANKKYLDATLLYITISLSSGQPMLEEYATNKETMRADADVKRFFGALRPQTREAAEASLKALKELEGIAEEGRFALGLFSAPVQLSLRKPGDVTETYLDVLDEHPYIVGGWKDLGDVYFRRYDATSAWLCWDAARQIQPDHKMLAPINEFEERLRRDMPDFFLSLEPGD